MKVIQICFVVLGAPIELAIVGYFIALAVYTAVGFMNPHSCPMDGPCPQLRLF